MLYKVRWMQGTDVLAEDVAHGEASFLTAEIREKYIERLARDFGTVTVYTSEQYGSWSYQ